MISFYIPTPTTMTEIDELYQLLNVALVNHYGADNITMELDDQYLDLGYRIDIEPRETPKLDKLMSERPPWDNK